MRNYLLLTFLLLGVGIFALQVSSSYNMLTKYEQQDIGCIRIQQYQKLGIYVKNICDSKHFFQISIQDPQTSILYDYKSACMGPQESAYFTPQVDNQILCQNVDCVILNTSQQDCQY
ncbi:hypothetical protein ABPG74_001788 [Tetrahymena malaccensis]